MAIQELSEAKQLSKEKCGGSFFRASSEGRPSSSNCGRQVFKNLFCYCCFLLPDDLPDLQEVEEGAQAAALPVYQVDMGVSHQERPAHTQPADTHWLTQLAHIATGPQSPLLQECPLSR